MIGDRDKACVYFEQTADGIRLSKTSGVDAIVRRLNRAARRASSTRAIVAAVIVDKPQAKKLRRLIDRAWSSHRRGGGIFTVSAAEARQVAQHLADKFGMTVYGTAAPLSEAASNLALEHFARGRRAKWSPGSGEDMAAITELYAAGFITRHKGGLYKGTERTAAAARKRAKSRVPARGKPAIVVPNTPIIGEAIVPEPHMARELLLARMEEASEAGDDPHDVLHRDAYRGALVNLRDQLGGFATLDLDEFQRRGVAEFRQTGEEGQLGGAKAIDYAVTRVDSSLVNTVTEAGAVARAEHRSAIDMLKAPRDGEDDKDRKPGLVRAAVAERLAVLGHSLRDVSIAIGMGSGGQGRQRTKAIAMGVATDLARHFGFYRGRRSAIRGEGSRPTNVASAYRYEIPAEKARNGEKA